MSAYSEITGTGDWILEMGLIDGRMIAQRFQTQAELNFEWEIAKKMLKTSQAILWLQMELPIEATK